MTVGTGTRPDVYIVKPLVKSIMDSRPDYVVLVVTQQSLRFGQDIVKELGLSEDSFSIEVLKEFDDFQSVFRSVNEIFEKLRKLGFNQNEIQVDFTSGTKAMSSGVVLSAIYNECESVKYITGQRKNGIVVDDTERFVSVFPSMVFLLHDIQMAKQFITELRFATAGEMLGKVRPEILNDFERAYVKNLLVIAKAYLAWDVFDHAAALRNLEKVDWSVPELEPFKPSSHILEALKQITRSQGKEKNYLLLLDLFNNATRRGREGKYDDAVARLYRATELFAQQLLADERFSIDTSDVDLCKVPESLRATLEKQRSELDGKIRIGMEMDFMLLKELGHHVGEKFFEDKQLRGQLSERNYSILAHGLRPIRKSLYKKLHSSVVSLFETEIPNFSSDAQALQFPWLQAAA